MVAAAPDAAKAADRESNLLMNWHRRYGNKIERAIDAAVFGIVVVVAIHAPNAFTKAPLLTAAALLLIGGLIAWRRR
jgi:hypothetical protein